MISQRHRIQSTNLQEVIRHHSGHGALTIRIKDWPEFIGRRIKDVRMEDSRALTVLRGKSTSGLLTKISSYNQMMS